MSWTGDASDSTVPKLTESTPARRVVSGFWRRLLALGVDSLVLGLAGALAGVLLFDSLASLGVWGRLLGFSVALVYFGLLNSSVGTGQTVGKRDYLAITVSYGYDIGIAQSWRSETVRHPPQVWEEMLGVRTG